jgi:hypothetical protein
MSSKIKHNKKRNTAFLYEALVRELTKASIKKDNVRKNTIISIFKDFFKPGTILYRDYKLYENIVNTQVEERRLAEKIIVESRLERSALDNKRLFNEQSALISRINKELSSDIYSNFVPNYKDLATLHQIFNNPKIEAKKRVILEESIVDSMVATGDMEESKSMKHIDNIVYKTFVEKFNNSYSNLNENQKQMLKAYTGSVNDNGIEMKIYLDDEISRLKRELDESIDMEVFPEDRTEIHSLLQGMKDRELVDSDFTKILKIQQLVEELKSNDKSTS